MSRCFKWLNCVPHKQARRKQIKTWVTECMMEGFKRPYIVDTCYNLIDAPLNLIKLAITKIIETPNIRVTIAYGRTYTHIGMANIEIMVEGVFACVQTLVSTGDQIMLGLD